MTSEGSDAGQSSSPEGNAGASEPTSGGYEAPAIENDQRPSTDSPPAYANPAYDPPQYEQQPYGQPLYEAPPPYEPPRYEPPQYEQQQFGQQPSGAPGYPPPPGGGFPPGYPPPADPGFPQGGYPPPPPYGAAPGGYPPPPGYPQAPGYGQPPPYGVPNYGYGAYGPTAKTNVLAILSLVASVISLCGIGSIAGIVLGVVALNQIKTSGEQGRLLAIAGIVVGGVTLLFSLLWLAFVASS